MNKHLLATFLAAVLLATSINSAEVEAGGGYLPIVTPVHNQNLTADITYGVLSGNATYVNMTWWYSTDNVTFTNLTSRYNSTEIATGRAWNGTLGVADLTDGSYYLKVSGNNSEYNSTPIRVSFDDTVPSITALEGNATITRVSRSINFLIHATDGISNSSGFTDGVANCTLHIETEGYVQATDGGANTFYYNLTAAGGGNKWFRASCTDAHSQSSAYTNYFTYSVGGGTSEDGYVVKQPPTQAIVPAPSAIKIGEKAIDKRIIGILAVIALAFWLFKKK